MSLSMNSFACPITRDCYSVLLLVQRVLNFSPYILPPPGEPTQSVLRLSSCHGETSSVAMTAQQSPIETMVITTTSANQSLCEVDSDGDVLQNAYSCGKLDYCATGMLYNAKLRRLEMLYCKNTCCSTCGFL